MTGTAIKVENLSKRYRIGQYVGSGAQYKTLRESLTNAVSAPLRRLKSISKFEIRNSKSDTPQSDRFIWALRDVSFEVKQGEVLGIIGRNGAGKSTLLKVLTRITEPTDGRAELNGRVGSLLEVGTGFHPELTGRENVYLSGAILGMGRKEIDKKFDEIVDFSGVETYIDTPVKRYSSGMRVRLGFAVAAHLEPEILLIDEVLAVGDAAFQKKCLGKMGSVAKEGRTVLFVSHNMGAIENLCEKAMLLDSGSVVMQSNATKTIQYYLETVLPPVIEDIPLAERRDRSGNGTIRLIGFHIEDVDGNKLMAARSGMDIVLVFGYQCRDQELPRHVDVGFSIHDKETLAVLYSSYSGQVFETVPPTGEFRCLVARLPLSKGRYRVGARVTVSGQEADWPRSAVGYLDIEAGDFYGTGREGFGASAPLLLMGQWEVEGLTS